MQFPRELKQIGWSTGLCSVLVIVLWHFPALWYTQPESLLKPVWLDPQLSVPGWTYQNIPIDRAAEAVLTADRLLNGEFTQTNGACVRVFSAKRYAESGNEIGLFVHTPDRCWTESGWKMEPDLPEFKQLFIHGIPLCLERRVFTLGAQRELVYFTGLVGGQSLPFRLDHNLSVGMRQALHTGAASSGSMLRMSDGRFWHRVWESFTARRPLVGPKQFLRFSTTISGNDLTAAERRLNDFLPQWLRPIGYDQELNEWRQHAAAR